MIKYGNLLPPQLYVFPPSEKNCPTSLPNPIVNFLLYVYTLFIGEQASRYASVSECGKDVEILLCTHHSTNYLNYKFNAFHNFGKKFSVASGMREVGNDKQERFIKILPCYFAFS